MNVKFKVVYIQYGVKLGLVQEPEFDEYELAVGWIAQNGEKGAGYKIEKIFYCN